MKVYETVWAEYKRCPVRGEFAAKLRERTRAAGISQGALARRAGFDPTCVSRWLTGQREPTLESKLLLEEAVDQLLEEAENV
jgi:transcriptional regulator with XRE-family HTH domain